MHMEIKAGIQAVVNILQTNITLLGYTVSFLDVLIYMIGGTIVCVLVGKMLS